MTILTILMIFSAQRNLLSSHFGLPWPNGGLHISCSLQGISEHSAGQKVSGVLPRAEIAISRTESAQHISGSSHASIICYPLTLQVTYRTAHMLQSYVTHSHASIICYPLILHVTYRTAHMLQSYVTHSHASSICYPLILQVRYRTPHIL